MRGRSLVAAAVLLSALAAGAQEPGTHDPDEAHHARLHAPTYARTVAFLEERLERSPNDVRLLGKLARTHLEAGRATGDHLALASAVDRFEELLRTGAASAPALRGLARAELGRHRFEAARRAARAAAHRAPDDPGSWALLGDVAFAEGRYVEAELAAVRCAEVEPSLASFARLGLVHEVRGRLDRARTCFENALAAGRIEGATRADLAWVTSLSGDHELLRGDRVSAEEHFRSALELDPDSRYARHGLARTLRSSGRTADAIDVLGGLVRDCPAPAQWFALADALHELDDLEDARRWEALAVHDVEVDLARGEFGHARELAEHLARRGERLDLALELALGELERRRDVDGLALAARLLHSAGRGDEARELLDEALGWGGRDGRLRALAATVLGGG